MSVTWEYCGQIEYKTRGRLEDREYIPSQVGGCGDGSPTPRAKTLSDSKSRRCHSAAAVPGWSLHDDDQESKST